MPKKPIIIISVLCVISLALGYLSGLKEEDSISNGDAKTDSKKEPEFLKEGLVAYYPFNGNAKDESGNGNNGTVAGGSLANTDRLGENDRAWTFDGVDDYVDILHHESLNLAAGGLTLSAWIRPDDNRKSAIISKGDSITDNDAYNLYIINDELHYSWRVSVNGSLPNITTTNAPLKIGEWTHVALTHQSGSPPTLYINGAAINAITSLEDLTQPRMDNGEPLKLGSGKRAGNPHNLFKGKLDDVRICDRALSADEVKALYEFEKAN
jgi:hypothetical protein